MKRSPVVSKKIKSNDRMPQVTQARVREFMQTVERMREPHRSAALEFIDRVTPAETYRLLHSMRRWYSGQTMARKIVSARCHLVLVMRLAPRDAVGCFRGLKVPKAHRLAQVAEGDRILLDVPHNRGLSSWTTERAAADRFSGGGNGKTGLVVRLTSDEGVTPILAPPHRTDAWFNRLYADVIGASFRPTEKEYLLAGRRIAVEVVRVKK